MKVILSNQQSSLSSIHLFLNPCEFIPSPRLYTSAGDFIPDFLISILNIINHSIL
jgi:hypothetical protein